MLENMIYKLADPYNATINVCVKLCIYSVNKTGNNICSMCKIILQCYIMHYGFPDSLPLLRWEVKCFSCLAGWIQAWPLKHADLEPTETYRALL